MIKKISHRQQAIINHFEKQNIMVTSIKGVGANYEVYGLNEHIQPIVRTVTRKEATQMLKEQESLK